MVGAGNAMISNDGWSISKQGALKSVEHYTVVLTQFSCLVTTWISITPFPLFPLSLLSLRPSSTSTQLRSLFRQGKPLPSLLWIQRSCNSTHTGVDESHARMFDCAEARILLNLYGEVVEEPTCRDATRMAKELLELNLPKGIKDKKKGFFCCCCFCFYSGIC